MVQMSFPLHVLRNESDGLQNDAITDLDAKVFKMLISPKAMKYPKVTF